MKGLVFCCVGELGCLGTLGVIVPGGSRTYLRVVIGRVFSAESTLISVLSHCTASLVLVLLRSNGEGSSWSFLPAFLRLATSQLSLERNHDKLNHLWSRKISRPIILGFSDCQNARPREQ